jgi:hypothetical protein
VSHARLNKAERRQLEAVEAELARWGLTYTLERTKHLIMVVEGPRGGRWRLTLACTPRNADDAVGHARLKARHIIRDINEKLGLFK